MALQSQSAYFTAEFLHESSSLGKLTGSGYCKSVIIVMMMSLRLKSNTENANWPAADI